MPIAKKAKRALRANDEAPLQGRTSKRRMDRSDEIINWRKLKVATPVICIELTSLISACCGADCVSSRGHTKGSTWHWGYHGLILASGQYVKVTSALQAEMFLQEQLPTLLGCRGRL